MKSANIILIFNSIYVKVLVGLLLLYLFLPETFVSDSALCLDQTVNVDNCLDASWTLSINWALLNNLKFGTDYIFTYGPLGMLSTRVPVGINPLYFLIFDIFVFANLGFIYYYFLKKNLSLNSFLLIILFALSVTFGGFFFQQIVFFLLLIAIFWLQYSVSNARPVFFTIPLIITCLLFFIKVNISFVTLPIYYAYLIYFSFLNKKNLTVSSIFGLLLPFSIFALSFPLNTEIFSYITGSLSLIDGYNDAMNSGGSKYLPITILAVIEIAVFIILFFKQNSEKLWILYFVFLIFSFVLFKQSFLRSDLHVAGFYSTFPAICGLSLLFVEKISKKIAVVFAFICLISFGMSYGLGISRNIFDRGQYFGQLFNIQEINQKYEANFARFSLPNEVGAKIGSKTVDIIPWNISYLHFNKLIYNPRPVIQSYSVYNSYLETVNARKYESETAPDFVIYSEKSIDNRYAFFDDHLAKVALLKNYEDGGIYKAEDSDFLLLEKSLQKKTIEFSEPKSEKINIDQEYFLENADKIYFIKFNLNYSVFGKVLRTIYRPIPINIEFRLKDGSIKENRVLLPVLNTGVLINPYIENELDFQNLLNRTEAAKKIVSFKLKFSPSGKLTNFIADNSYKNEIDFSVSEVIIKTD